MEPKESVEPYYQRRAVELIDMLYNKRFLNDAVARESFKDLEDFLGWLLQSQCESAVRGAELTTKFRGRRDGNQHSVAE